MFRLRVDLLSRCLLSSLKQRLSPPDAFPPLFALKAQRAAFLALENRLFRAMGVLGKPSGL